MNEQLRMDVYEDVKAFLDAKYPYAVGSVPQWPRHDRQIEVSGGVSASVAQLFEAVNKGDLTATVEGIVSSITTLTGMAVAMGVDLRPIWAAVHKARMQGGEGADVGLLLSLQEPLNQPMAPAKVD